MRINALVENELREQNREIEELREEIDELRSLLAVKDAEIAQMKSCLAAIEDVGE